MSIPHSYSITKKCLRYMLNSVGFWVSIPHSYSITSIIFTPSLLIYPIVGVSIPHSYSITIKLKLDKLMLKVSIPHSYSIT